MGYQDIPPITREDLDTALHSGAADKIARAVLAISLHDKDLAFAQDLCLRTAADKNPTVRSIGVTGLGHLARRFGRIDQNKVEPILQWALIDPDPDVRGPAEAAADSIDRFTGWHVRHPSGRADA